MVRRGDTKSGSEIFVRLPLCHCWLSTQRVCAPNSHIIVIAVSFSIECNLQGEVMFTAACAGTR